MLKPATWMSLSDWPPRSFNSIVPHWHAVHSPPRSGSTPISIMIRARSSGLMRAMSTTAILLDIGSAAREGRSACF
eukprot:6304869-Pyramimonas_sp.AAC.2